MHVLIVDDHPLFREGLRTLLAALDPEVRTSEAATVLEAIALADSEAPDLILLDMNLPGVSRLEALRELKLAYETGAVVIVSGDEDPALIRSAIDQGAAGYIPKTTDSALTVQALRLVLAHGIYLPRVALVQPGPGTAASASASGSGSGSGSGSKAAELLPEFSGRQLAVLKSMLQGKANKVIARELDIAEGTVKAHLWAIYQALGVSTRAQAMYRVHELRLFGATAS